MVSTELLLRMSTHTVCLTLLLLHRSCTRPFSGILAFLAPLVKLTSSLLLESLFLFPLLQVTLCQLHMRALLSGTLQVLRSFRQALLSLPSPARPPIISTQHVRCKYALDASTQLLAWCYYPFANLHVANKPYHA